MHGLITSIENLLTKKATGTNYKMVALCPLPFVVAPVPDTLMDLATRSFAFAQDDNKQGRKVAPERVEKTLACLR
jgi:hypothetical protein